MAKRRTYTLSEKTAREIATLTRQSRQNPTLLGTVRTVDADQSIIGKWAKLTSIAEGESWTNGRKRYLGSIFSAPGGTHAISTGVRIMNAWEIENTAEKQAGYAIVTSAAECGDIIGTSPLPIGQWYQVLDIVVEDGAKYAVISQRNDPAFQES